MEDACTSVLRIKFMEQCVTVPRVTDWLWTAGHVNLQVLESIPTYYMPCIYTLHHVLSHCIVTGTYTVFQAQSFSYIVQYALSSAVVYFEYHLHSRNLIACFSRRLDRFVD